MCKEELLHFLDINNIQYERDVNLKTKTWIRRGGKAGIFISPIVSCELENVVRFLYDNEIDFLLLGHTSNMYILNECNPPVVVSTSKCTHYKINEGNIYCEAGVSVIRLSKHMIRYGWSGFEYLTGLPGTIGASLINNSSCRDNSISSLLVSARVLLNDGIIRTYTPDDFKFEFRSSVFKRREVKGTIIDVLLKTIPGDANELQKIANNNDKVREKILEGYSKNLGCTVNQCFKYGKMSTILKLILAIYSRILKIVKCPNEKIMELKKYLICALAGYKAIAPYVSSKNPIIFQWLDEGADKVFPLYLEFMRKVYKTDEIEIEVIK